MDLASREAIISRLRSISSGARFSIADCGSLSHMLGASTAFPCLFRRDSNAQVALKIVADTTKSTPGAMTMKGVDIPASPTSSDLARVNPSRHMMKVASEQRGNPRQSPDEVDE